MMGRTGEEEEQIPWQGCDQLMVFVFVQGVFFNWPSPFSVPKRKTAFSQWELLFHEILHLRKPLVGSLAYFLFSTEWGGGS